MIENGLTFGEEHRDLLSVEWYNSSREMWRFAGYVRTLSIVSVLVMIL
jgi:hypothetical protein